MVKAYPTGVVSSYLHSLKVGDQVEVKGPMRKLKYSPNAKKTITMIAGGTGITPMYQVLQEITHNPTDTTEVHLLYANHTEKDIILRDELLCMARACPNIKVTFVTGHITKDMIAAAAKPSADTWVFVCGPPGFMTAVSGPKTVDYKQGPVCGYLQELGYNEDMVFKF